MDRTYLIIAIAIIGALVLLFIIFPGQKGTSKATTATTTVGSGPSTTLTPAVIDITAINVQYTFNGSETENGVNCNYNSNAYIDTSDARTLNGSQTFYLTFKPGSGSCPVDFTSVTTQTPGFSIVSVTPTLPFTYPPNSQAELLVGIKAPDTNFYGPMRLTLTYT